MYVYKLDGYSPKLLFLHELQPPPSIIRHTSVTVVNMKQENKTLSLPFTSFRLVVDLCANTPHMPRRETLTS